ncbi:MAG TPA: signal peptidase I [Candidatus Saccharimonadaceae bacterium]|nr:signal peptidase I [Candidatus Saccharimonadaceae bacterium]|tara:strand:+ start:2892 stop:3491 length:600 start_codon:yes stop_codon:yes gene_type:complete
MEASYFTRHPFLKDVLNIIIFIVCVVIGTTLINTFVFRSYNVIGPSMQPTMTTGDRLIVNRLPVTWAQLTNQPYIPEHGQVIVFDNPKFQQGVADEYIVKRVIGLPGERVVLENGTFTVYNGKNPNGFNPDTTHSDEPASPAVGAVDVVVPEGELFVVGDNRVGNNSYDSRSGLGTVALYDVIGPVSARLFPFTEVRGF